MKEAKTERGTDVRGESEWETRMTGLDELWTAGNDGNGKKKKKTGEVWSG